MKKVLSVGQCVPDAAAIQQMLQSNFEVTTLKAATATEALEMLKSGQFELVLVNRKLDADYTDGSDIIKSILADAELAKVPVMLITNYPEHDEAAVELGAVSGFGKAAINDPATITKLSQYLT